MASIGKLVAALAKAEGMEEGSVKLIARYAREAGHISQGTYGPGAAKMTVSDAANLIIAVNAAENAKYSSKTIDLFRYLTTYIDTEFLAKKSKKDADDTIHKVAIRLSSYNNFGLFLEGLLNEYHPDTGMFGNGEQDVCISIGFLRPQIRAQVNIGKSLLFSDFEAIFVGGEDPTPSWPANRTDETRINGSVIEQIARVIFD